MKRMHNKYGLISIVVFLGVILSSCTEIYHPEIDVQDDVLVVDALITDQPGPYKISLSYAQPFDMVNSYRPIPDAEVYVIDNLGNRADFHANWKGEYFSDPELFQADTLSVYTLIINTSDQEVYRSEPVQMVKTNTSETSYGFFSKKQFLKEDVDGTQMMEEKDWVNIYLNTLITGKEIPGIRFEPKLVIFSLYYMDPYGQGDVLPFYAWRTYYPDIRVISEELAESTEAGGQIAYYDREICSFEYREFIKARDYRLEIDTMNSRIVKYALIIDQYHLNESSTTFYSDLARQVQSENRIFDPLPLDVRGNITCVTHPDRKVIGLFEVSGCQQVAFRILTRKDVNQVEVSPVEPLLPDPPLGSVPDEPPYFWIN